MTDHEIAGFEDLERTLRDALAVAPDANARARSRARILESSIPTRASRRPLRRHRLVAPLAAAFLVTSATGAAAVPASAHAIPGDALYGVRMATESIRIAIARDEAAVRLSVAQARTVDLERALTKGRDHAIEEIARRFFEQVSAVQGLQDIDPIVEAKIATQQARLDAIADRIEGQIGEEARADEVLRDIRRYDGRERGSSSRDGTPSDDANDQDKGRNGNDERRRGANEDRDTDVEDGRERGARAPATSTPRTKNRGSAGSGGVSRSSDD